jgi:hypothetical protein
MSPRYVPEQDRPVNRLSESNTIERARLELKHRTGQLDQYERHRRTLLLSGDPADNLSLGARAATSPAFVELAVKASKSGNTVPITEDVSLTTIGPAETKTLLRLGSATSVGAFTNVDDQAATYSPTRRPLELLDLVRSGTTTEGSISYVRQGSYTSVAAETAEATSTTTGTKPEATLPFEVVQSPVETSRSGPQPPAARCPTLTSSKPWLTNSSPTT